MESNLAKMQSERQNAEKRETRSDRRKWESVSLISLLTFRFSLFVLLLSAPIVITACSQRSSPQNTAVHAGYHCPMHPQYHSDKPGSCPICNMSLVPDADTTTAKKEHKVIYYRNPMNPQQTSPMPAKDSMGMDFVPVYEDEVQATIPVPGQATVTATESQQEQVGVRVAPVEKRDLFVSVRASARVAYDPGLYSAILEHQAAVEAAKNSAGPATYQTESEATVRASALRLRQMGLSPEQVRHVSRPGFDPANLLLGKAGETIWVYAEIYDYEANLVLAGQKADLTSPAFPGRTFLGTVRAVDSIVNAETRTLRARIETPNPQGELKPDMYLTASIHAALGRKLAVPEAAVMDTGTRKLVFVETASGQFEPRAIELGREADGYFEVRAGLQEGEKVSTAANFLIDSESKLKAAAQRQ